MNVKELKDFRAKLERAKELCKLNKFNCFVLRPSVDAGLVAQCAGVSHNNVMPDDVWLWYIRPNRTSAEREAMWDNSIAAVDSRIAKAK